MNKRIIPMACVSILFVASHAFAEDSPFAGDSLAVRKLIEKTTLCTDGKSHYVVVAPHEMQLWQLYYGDGKKFFKVPLPPKMLEGNWFLDPRYRDEKNNADFRGSDLRAYSHVTAESGKCALSCGGRTTDLQVVVADPKSSLLKAATFAPSPRTREPYALARDQKGKYYYVDRGATTETARSFRLFVGPKGALKLQKMTDVVADSEGEIFATKTGSLRLVLGHSEAVWIAHENKTKLLIVNVNDNLPMIYNQLGIYTGERLGTPCDDL